METLIGTMDLEKYRRESFSVLDGYGLASELSLIDAIHKHREERYLRKDQIQIFWQFVDTILKEKPDLNDYPAEEIGKMFAVRKYERKITVKNLAYYEVGKIWSKDAPRHTLEDFAFISENMESGFYLGYQPDYNAIHGIINKIDGRDENFLRDSRSMHIDREKIVEYMRSEFPDSLSDDEIIAKINIYSDGAYTELPLGVGTLGWFLLRDNQLELYAELLDRLYYFPLRGALIYQINHLEQCIQLWKILLDKKPSRWKVLCYQLREQMTRLGSKESEHLEKNCNNEELSEEDKQLAVSLYHTWQKQKPHLVGRCVELWRDCLGIEDNSIWYSKHKSYTDTKNPKFVRHEVETLKLIEEELTRFVPLDPTKFKDLDLQTLLYYSKIAVRNGADNNVCAALVNLICKHAYTDKFVQPFKLDERSLSTIRDVYRCLLGAGLDGIQLMLKYRCPTEGYGITYQDMYRIQMGDAFWFPILMMMAEEKANIDYLNYIIGIFLNFADFERNVTSDDYFVTFYLGELIVSQILKDYKDTFEKRMITSIPNLHFVLRALSANEGNMSDDIINLLRNRVSLEWEVEKELVSQQYREQSEFLDEYLHKANIL